MAELGRDYESRGASAESTPVVLSPILIYLRRRGEERKRRTACLVRTCAHTHGMCAIWYVHVILQERRASCRADIRTDNSRRRGSSSRRRMRCMRGAVQSTASGLLEWSNHGRITAPRLATLRQERKGGTDLALLGTREARMATGARVRVSITRDGVGILRGWSEWGGAAERCVRAKCDFSESGGVGREGAGDGREDTREGNGMRTQGKGEKAQGRSGKAPGKGAGAKGGM